jgi:hypothetical protein
VWVEVCRPCDLHPTRYTYQLKGRLQGCTFFLRHGHNVMSSISLPGPKSSQYDPAMRCVNAHVNPSFDTPVGWLSTGKYLAIWVRTAPAALCPNSVLSLSSWLTSRASKGMWRDSRYLRGRFDSGGGVHDALRP